MGIWNIYSSHDWAVYIPYSLLTCYNYNKIPLQKVDAFWKISLEFAGFRSDGYISLDSEQIWLTIEIIAVAINIMSVLEFSVNSLWC